MARRLELQRALESILGSKNVYFQPPSTLVMKYPCIVYRLQNIQKIFADDAHYLHRKQYMVTLITKDPVSPTIDALMTFDKMVFDRHYSADNLNHYVYRINY